MPNNNFYPKFCDIFNFVKFWGKEYTHNYKHNQLISNQIEQIFEILFPWKYFTKCRSPFDFRFYN